jgi:DNA 3'-phosphatase
MSTIDGKRFSKSVAEKILQERGLQGQVTVEDLVQATGQSDLHSAGYLSRDELELGASALAQTLGSPDREEHAGMRYSRASLDAAKIRLQKAGIKVTDAQMRQAFLRVDNGNGIVSKAEIALATAMIHEVEQLATLEEIAPPPRPGSMFESADATADLGRRKLADTFIHAGTGPIKVAFFDADSTLRISRSGSVSANGPTDVALLPFVGDKIKELTEDGYLIAVVSNQSGVRYGHVTLEDADEALQVTADLIRGMGGQVHYIDYAETNDNNRKPNTGMPERLDALLQDSFGSQAHIDKDASFMCGDSAFKRSETRPNGQPGTNFSNSDRKMAENFGIRFEEPNATFGWEKYGVHQIDDLQGRADFMNDFDVGRRVESSPLFARHALAPASSEAVLRSITDLPDALAAQVRALSGGPFPELDSGNSGLQSFMLQEADALRLLGVAKGWRMDPALQAETELLDFDPSRHVLLANLTTTDEPELVVHRVDRLTLEAQVVGVDMNFTHDTQALLEEHVPESLDASTGEYNGFKALHRLLQAGEHLNIGGAAEGIDEDFTLDRYRV